MELDEGRRHIPGGGRARDMRTGSIHLSVRSGSRSRGASASAAFAYVTRTGDFAERDLDEAVYTESDHMPAWAQEDPQTFWEAADLYERANGRLFVSADFASESSWWSSVTRCAAMSRVWSANGSTGLTR